MATSSIFANVVIKDKKSARRFVAALETSSRDTKKEKAEQVVPLLTDHDALKRLMAKRKNVR